MNSIKGKKYIKFIWPTVISLHNTELIDIFGMHAMKDVSPNLNLIVFAGTFIKVTRSWSFQQKARKKQKHGRRLFYEREFSPRKTKKRKQRA